MTEPLFTVDRRLTLMWLSSSLAAACGPGIVPEGARGAQIPLPDAPIDPASAKAARQPSGTGYGTDPNLFEPDTSWQKIMTERQRLLAATLADLILPKEDEHPVPSELGVHDFIDEWVSAPYPEQIADSAIILEGLAMVDDAARLRQLDGFVEASPKEQIAILEGFAQRGDAAAQSKRRVFFEKMRQLVLGAYYTTQVGFDAIGFVGNVAMLTYPGPSKEIRETLDADLRRLGL